jgi:hypothetical protein
VQGAAEFLIPSAVAPAQQPLVDWSAIQVPGTTGGEKSEAIMFARMTADGRLLGFNIGDWSMLVGGCMLAGLLAFPG